MIAVPFTTSTATQAEAYLAEMVALVRRLVVRLASDGRPDDAGPYVLAVEALADAIAIAWNDDRLRSEIRVQRRAERGAGLVRAVALPTQRAQRRRDAIAIGVRLTKAIADEYDALDNAER